jgi:hypothetical protein
MTAAMTLTGTVTVEPGAGERLEKVAGAAAAVDTPTNTKHDTISSSAKLAAIPIAESLRTAAVLN